MATYEKQKPFDTVYDHAFKEGNLVRIWLDTGAIFEGVVRHMHHDMRLKGSGWVELTVGNGVIRVIRDNVVAAELVSQSTDQTG
jgi:hypothetical protein